MYFYEFNKTKPMKKIGIIYMMYLKMQKNMAVF